MAGHLRAAAVAVATFAAAHAVSASAQTVFMNDFNTGLTSSESVSGAFTVADGYLGNHAPNYSNGETDVYTLSVNLLSGMSSYLNFDLQYNTESNYDFLRVYANNSLLQPLSGPTYSPGLGYSGSGAGRANFDLSSFSGLTTIRLQFTTDGSVVSSGIKIDELDVGALTLAAPTAVPEPASWAMMIFGMGAVGFAMRRRKVTTRVSYAA